VAVAIIATMSCKEESEAEEVWQRRESQLAEDRVSEAAGGNGRSSKENSSFKTATTNIAQSASAQSASAMYDVANSASDFELPGFGASDW
jgi:hypothetical protein